MPSPRRWCPLALLSLATLPLAAPPAQADEDPALEPPHRLLGLYPR